MTAKRTNRSNKGRRVGHVAVAAKGKAASVRRRKSISDAINFEALEGRQMMSVVNVANFGATPNDGRDDRAAIQSAIDTAKSGDTVMLAAGQYDINGQLTMRSNRTLTGAANRASKLVFNTATNQFGMILEGDATNLTIDGIAIKANCGGIVASSRTFGVKITNNDFEWGYNGTYYNRLGIRAGAVNDGMIIERNYFHDSLISDRSVDLYDMRNSSYSYNTFYRVNDGGHVDGLSQNFKFVGNVGKQVHRMGLELQDHNGRGGDNIVIANNVFTDWYKPYWDSFGLSIMPQFATNVVIKNNYLSAVNKVDGWGITDSSGANRYGYGIEAGLTSGIVEGNIIAGGWVAGVAYSMPNTPLKDNKAYGSQAWGAFVGEPGNGPGPASLRDLGGNQSGLPLSQVPPPPSNPSAPPTNTDGITEVKGQVLSDTSAKLTWKVTGLRVRSFRIDIASTQGGERLPSVTVAGTATEATLTNLRAGWHLDFTLVAITDSGEVRATPLTLQMTGGAQPAPTPGSISAYKVTPIKDNTVRINWQNNDVRLRSVTIEIVSTEGGEKFPSVTFKGDRDHVIVSPVHPGWKLDFRIVATTIGGAVLRSKVMTVQMPGDPNAPFDPSPAVPAPTAHKNKRYLEHMQIRHSHNQLGEPEINASVGGAASSDGRPMTINGQTFSKGVGVTASSKLVYSLQGRYKYFCSYIGLDDESKRGQVTFQVWGDGHKLYDSGAVNEGSRLRKVKVDVQGVKQIWLVVTPVLGGATNASVHADWAQSYLLAA